MTLAVLVVGGAVFWWCLRRAPWFDAPDCVRCDGTGRVTLLGGVRLRRTTYLIPRRRLRWPCPACRPNAYAHAVQGEADVYGASAPTSVPPHAQRPEDCR